MTGRSRHADSVAAPSLADFATAELMRMAPAARYAAIIGLRELVVSRARAESALLTRWAAVQIRALAADGLPVEEMVAVIRSAGGKVSGATVRRILAAKTSPRGR